MIIHRIINNNFAVVLDGASKEKIIMGKGVSFGKKAGDALDPSLIEKEFILVDKDIRERFKTVISEVSPACLKITEQIIDKANKTLNKKLNENIYVALTDHIQFAINRYHQGLQLKNDMLWHIKKMYPEEYKLGNEALGLVKDEFGIRLINDEASFIALHIISAETNEEMQHVINITKIVKDILSIVTNHFSIFMDEDSIYYYRFVTHLKFFAQRISNESLYLDSGGKDEPLFIAVKTNYPDAFACAKKIAVYIENTQNHYVTNEELLYLTIHIKRIILKD